MTDDRRWLRGHPAILLPEDQLQAYAADSVDSPPEPVVAFETVGDGYRGLVLHDPESATFLPRENGGVLGQLIFADDWDLACAELLANFPADGWTDLGFVYEATADRHVLFDSVYAGSATSDPDELAVMGDMDALPVHIELPRGRYAVRGQVQYAAEPDAEWSLIELVRLD